MKKFSKSLLRKGGRNNTGRITVYHRGGGVKRIYRFIDFWRRLDSKGIVLYVMPDAFRNAHIALVVYKNGLMGFILASDGMKIGDYIWTGQALLEEVNSRPFKSGLPKEGINSFVKIWPNGSAIQLGLCPVGLQVFNIELNPGTGGQLCRAAGTFAVVVKKVAKVNKVILRLKSGLMLALPDNCMASVGLSSNANFKNFEYGSAGAVRRRGRRPVVRGVAMNPIDHPHGGGEGKTSGGHKPKSPWGWCTKGVKTVSKRKRALKWKQFQKWNI